MARGGKWPGRTQNSECVKTKSGSKGPLHRGRWTGLLDRIRKGHFSMDLQKQEVGAVLDGVENLVDFPSGFPMNRSDIEVCLGRRACH